MSFNVGDRVYWKIKPEYIGTVHEVFNHCGDGYVRIGVLWDDVPNFGVLVNEAERHGKVDGAFDNFEVDA